MSLARQSLFTTLGHDTKTIKPIAILALLFLAWRAWAGDDEFDPSKIYDRLDLDIYHDRGIIVPEQTATHRETIIVQTNWTPVFACPSVHTNDLRSCVPLSGTNVFFRLSLGVPLPCTTAKVGRAESDQRQDEKSEAPAKKK